MVQMYRKSSGAFYAVCTTTFCAAIFGVWACTSHGKVSASETLLKVSGYITQTSSYCGGARPSEEMLEEYGKPKPYPGKTLYISKSGSREVFSRFVSNDSGYFSLSLPAGSYRVWQDEQLRPFKPGQESENKMIVADTSCLRRWWNTPLGEFELESESVNLKSINFHRPCFVSGDVPCMSYTGPMPP